MYYVLMLGKHGRKFKKWKMHVICGQLWENWLIVPWSHEGLLFILAFSCQPTVALSKHGYVQFEPNILHELMSLSDDPNIDT